VHSLFIVFKKKTKVEGHNKIDSSCLFSYFFPSHECNYFNTLESLAKQVLQDVACCHAVVLRSVRHMVKNISL
jgi:hypothetical protein